MTYKDKALQWLKEAVEENTTAPIELMKTCDEYVFGELEGQARIDFEEQLKTSARLQGLVQERQAFLAELQAGQEGPALTTREALEAQGIPYVPLPTRQGQEPESQSPSEALRIRGRELQDLEATPLSQQLRRGDAYVVQTTPIARPASSGLKAELEYTPISAPSSWGADANLARTPLPPMDNIAQAPKHAFSRERVSVGADNPPTTDAGVPAATTKHTFAAPELRAPTLRWEATLHIEGKDGTQREVDLRDGENFLGRAAQETFEVTPLAGEEEDNRSHTFPWIEVDDPQVSRGHALLYFDAETGFVSIQGLEDKHHIILLHGEDEKVLVASYKGQAGGQEIMRVGLRVLRDGDTFMLGKTRFCLELRQSH